MTVFAHILFFAALLANFVINFIHFMHMFQLNSYSAHEHFEWWKKNRSDMWRRAVWPEVYFFIAAIVALLANFDVITRLIYGLLPGAGAVVLFMYAAAILCDLLPYIGAVMMLAGVISAAIAAKKGGERRGTGEISGLDQ